MLDDSREPFPDELGLREAYSSPEGVVRHGDTLYVAGTRSLRDVVDDTLIPLRQVHRSQRYGNALGAIQKGNGEVKYLVGHSLGGAIAARLLEDFPDLVEARAYGAPLWRSHATARLKAFRRRFDPVSMFDGAASTTQAPGFNPHSYAGAKRSTVRQSSSTGQTK